MSGRALKKSDSHAAIHEAALNEAGELTQLLAKCLAKQKSEQSLEVAHVLVEHWETRTLEHARAEENGLYKELSEKSQAFDKTVIELTRDHELLRRITGEIKDYLALQTVGDGVLQRFQALIFIDHIHNQDEIHWVLQHEKKSQKGERADVPS